MKLRNYIKHKGLLFLGTFSKLIEVVLELFVPIFMGILVDKGVVLGDKDITYKMLILIFIFALLGYLSTVFAHLLTSKVSQDYSNELRLAIFDKVIDLNFEDRSKFSTSSLINRLNSDVLQTSNALAMTMRIGSRAPFLMLGSVISLLIQAKNIALVFLIVIPVVIFIIILIVILLIKNNQKLQNETDKLSLIIKENVEGIQTIQAFVQSDYEIKRYSSQNNFIKSIQKLILKIQSFGQPTVSIILNLTLVLMLFLASKSINSGFMLQGQAIAMINYTSSLIISVFALFNLILLYARAITANARIRAILSVKIDDVKSANELTEIKKISFKDVGFKYEDQHEFIKNLNFEVSKSEIIGVIGLTGSGKSTLLKLINNLLDAKEGIVLINEEDIHSFNKEDLLNKFGFVDQSTSVLKGTIKSNLEMGKSYEINDLLESLRLSGLEPTEYFLNKELVKGGLNLSGGQRQRLNIARALIKKPQVLVLDDVFASLDNQTQQLIKNNLLNLEFKPIIFVASSTINSMDFVDKVLVIHQGKIENFIDKESVLETSLIYKRLYESQEALKEVL